MAPVNCDVAHQPGDMYSLKPVYDQGKVDLPDCMYKVKNIYDDPNENNITSNMSADLKQLHDHQTKILSQLEQLTNEVKVISKIVGHTFGEQDKNTEQIQTSAKLKAPVVPLQLPDGVLDYVISVSPNQLSVAPLFIAEMLRLRGVCVSSPTQLHSSLIEPVPGKLMDFFGGPKGRTQVAPAKINFTFIWKKDPFCPSIIYSPKLQTRIYGDVNITRYLTRIFLPDLYDEMDLVGAAKIDFWLENAKQILHGSSKEKEAAMKSLNAQLGQHGHVCNDKMTVADISTLSAILIKVDSFQSLPKNVKNWVLAAPPSFLTLVKLIWNDVSM